MSRNPPAAEDPKRRFMDFTALLESYVASWTAENAWRRAANGSGVKPTFDPQQPTTERERAASG